MSRAFQLETNPGNARPLAQRHGERGVYFNPPAFPLEDGAGSGGGAVAMDELYDLPFTRRAAPDVHGARSPRYETVKHSHRAHARLLRRLHVLLDHRARGPRHPEPLGGERAARDPRAAPHGRLPRAPSPTSAAPPPTCTRCAARARRSSAKCRRLSCVHPGVCENLGTDHGPLIDLMQKVRKEDGRQARLHRQRRPLRPGRALARVRRGAGPPPRRRPAVGRARAREPRACWRR